MKILISGASGLIGRALVPFLRARGHAVSALSRSPNAGTWWDWEKEKFEWREPGPVDGVIHLAGENIGRRWTAERKARIYKSRVDGTQFLVRKLSELPQPPKTILAASATGFYGSRGDEWLDEQSTPGSGFLATTCREWETAARHALHGNVRLVHLRFGVVLAREGGALAKMLPVFRAGLGGQFGSGRQYWSWIAMDDLLAAVAHLLLHEEISGPVNLVSPQPVTNAEFTRTLGTVLGRPTFFGVPPLAVNLLLGEMGRESLLSSARVRPERLEKSGFRFEYPSLDSALRHTLGA